MGGGDGEPRRAVRLLAREIYFLSEEDRAWIFERLREDLAGFNLEEHPVDELNLRMQEARKILRRVVEHLGIEDVDARLELTMREFNAVPEDVREGWSAAQIASSHKSSWQLAKQVAFTSALLPASDAQEWARMRHVPRVGLRGAYQLTGVSEWLASKPKNLTMSAYDEWRVGENEQRAKKGLLPLSAAVAITAGWECSWRELVETVAKGDAPPAPVGNVDESGTGKKAHKLADLRAEPVAAPGGLRADPALRARRVNRARRALGLNALELSELAGLQNQTVGRIETGAVANPTFERMIALARTLKLPLDHFATDDGQRGFPSDAEREVGKTRRSDPVRRAQRSRQASKKRRT